MTMRAYLPPAAGQYSWYNSHNAPLISAGVSPCVISDRINAASVPASAAAAKTPGARLDVRVDRDLTLTEPHHHHRRESRADVVPIPSLGAATLTAVPTGSVPHSHTGAHRGPSELDVIQKHLGPRRHPRMRGMHIRRGRRTP
ncbi:hypothetical protein GCM10009872_39900 [Actinopolymorpha rutila]